MRLSEKPIDLIFLKKFEFIDDFWLLIFSSTLIIPDICCKNQSSHPVILEISSTVILFLSAVAILKTRSGTCSPNQPDILSLLLNMSTSVRFEASFNPERPISNERSAF